MVPPTSRPFAEKLASADPGDNRWSDSGRPLMWRLRYVISLPDMSRIKRYLISIGLGLVGLVLFLALRGAAWLSAY
jgi:hypothetical protein